MQTKSSLHHVAGHSSQASQGGQQFPLTVVSRIAFIVLSTILIYIPGLAQKPSNSIPVPLPPGFRSQRFIVRIDGRPADVLNAAANYYDVNFQITGPVTISITAPTVDYWIRGVEVQPWREQIRPTRQGATITFQLDHPAKLSISRPGDHLGGAEMIFLFANPPLKHAPSPNAKGVRYYGPGIHQGSIDAHSGDRIYLAPGSLILGGLNFWDVHDVKVYGLGTIVYDGPQNPNDDDGWRNKRNWHCVTMHEARHVEIDGITCAVRSRTWMIQMRDSHFITFDNIKEIGGSANNANQDGMDWLGGGDTVVRNSFIRAADDVFSMEGNWDGYLPAVMTIPGHEVNNITIEDSVLSTSISNIVRVGWPTKTFNSNGFTLKDSDVLHMGSGGCGIPFALFEFWGTPAAKGVHTNYLFDNIRLEDWYSLVQIQQQAPAVKNVTFRNIWAPELPALVGSNLMGDVTGVNFDAVKIGDHFASNASDIPVTTSMGAEAPTFSVPTGTPDAQFTAAAEGASVGKPIAFDATASRAGSGDITSYDWFFGDGTIGHGETIQHSFADSDGTLLDGSGSFRVMLRVTNTAGDTNWSAKDVVVPARIYPALHPAATVSGLHFDSYDNITGSTLGFAGQTASAQGESNGIDTSSQTSPTNFGFTFDGYINIPVDGGYTFHVLSRDGGLLRIDHVTVAQSRTPWPQVCGSVGNAVQDASGSIGLAAGLHAVHIEMTHTVGDNDFRILWEGPGFGITPLPAAAFSRDGHNETIQHE
jgi:hypothetical protein